jgi:hypothetical protein
MLVGYLFPLVFTDRSTPVWKRSSRVHDPSLACRFRPGIQTENMIFCKSCSATSACYYFSNNAIVQLSSLVQTEKQQLFCFPQYPAGE